MRPLSLKWRVSLVVAAAVAASMLLAGVVAYREMVEWYFRSLDRGIKIMLNDTARALAEEGPDSEIEARVREIVGVSSAPQTPCVRIWMDGTDGDLLVVPAEGPAAAVLEPRRLDSMRPPRAEHSVRFNVQADDFWYRAIWRRYDVRGKKVNIAVAISSTFAHTELAEFRWDMFFSGCVILPPVIALATVLVWLGLRPISRTAKALDRITGSSIEEAQFPPPKGPSELKPFVESVMGVLERLATALREQKRFTANASHELRTPLALARSTIDATLLRERSPSEYRQSLAELKGDVERMTALTEALLMLARLDSAEAGREMELFDLKQTIEDVAHLFERRASETGKRISVNTRPLHVHGNPMQIGCLFSNLIDNAIRHSPPGGTIELTMQPEDGCIAVVTVRDEGGAIPAEALPHVFERFYRADASRSRASGGAGLGLSIAREIALRHGGDITAESSPDKGTTFQVRLPKA